MYVGIKMHAPTVNLYRFLNFLLKSMFLKPILIQRVFLAICVAIIIIDVVLVVYDLFSLVILPFASTCHEDHTVICVIFGYVEFHARYKKNLFRF